MVDRTLEVELPTMHEDQADAWEKLDEHQFLAVRCGRRWGKTTFGVAIAGDDCLNGLRVGWFAPETKFLSEPYADLVVAMGETAAKHNHNHLIRSLNGGQIDFWSLENPLAGRGRKYHRIVIDEAARTKANMMDIWRNNLLPTLIDYSGGALIMSNPAGDDKQAFFWQICNQKEHGFVEHHAPTHANPLIPFRRPGESEVDWLMRRTLEFAKIERNYSPLAFRQEILAQFVNWAGVAFFAEQSLLLDGRPVEYPRVCDYVFATIDTATKDGKEHDGTAVTYWARNTFPGWIGGPLVPLTILDYDLIQIEGASLEEWLPGVFTRLQELARLCGARRGAIGAWIEDKSSGTILLQQAQKKSALAHPIDSKLTSLGKTARALNVSGYVHRGEVKFSREAYNRTTTFKGITENHLLSQVTSFRVGEVESGQNKLKNDDAFDTFCYGVAIALGDAGGF